jgi:ketosteroid isomerase-like protein
MKADAEIEAEVMAVVKRFFEAFSNRDLDSIPLLFVTDPDLVFIGTGADEKGIGLSGLQAECERAFAQSEAASLELGWHLVSAAGQVAWVTLDAVVRAITSGRELSFPVRGTIVLERRGEKWLIVQSHMSAPAAGQKEGESWPSG